MSSKAKLTEEIHLCPHFSDDFALLWKKGKDMVALGSILYKSGDNRVKLEETNQGNTLMISLAEPSDAGEYTCQVSSSSGDYIKHNIQIRGKINY